MYFTRNFLFLLSLLVISEILTAQVGIGTSTPANSAMLDVQSNDKGFLLPRMTSAQRVAIISPVSGLQVYDTNTNSIWYFNGVFWVNTQAMASAGDVKSGIQTADHSGWVLLDGRPLTSLTVTQQAVATSLGLSGTLPNASNSYLSQNGGTLGAVSGANTVTLTQGNLPNVFFPVTVNNSGDHTHAVDPVAVNTSNNGNHSHSVDPNSVPTSTNGNHTHTGSVSGSGWNAGGAFVGGFDAGGFGLYTQILTIDQSGDHNHTVDIPSTTSSTSGDHLHSIDIPSTTSTASGNHTHVVTVSSGGSGTAFNIAPRSLTVNMFIYLGL